MLVDNFEVIMDKVLRFNEPGKFPTLFYAVEIIKRKKDPGNENGKNEELIDLFMIYSKSDMLKYQEKIKTICQENTIVYEIVCCSIVLCCKHGCPCAVPAD